MTRAEEVRALYDQWSPEWLSCAGTTFQSGLVKASAADREDPDASTRLCAAAVGLRDGDRVLDCGCGCGGPACALLEAYRRCTLVGVTLSPVQAALARRLAGECNVGDRARFEVADYHALPFDDASFDVVFYFEVTGYSTDPGRLYREAARVLRPGGRVYVKDVFRRPGTLGAREEAAMVNFDKIWACERTGTLGEADVHARAAGFDTTTRLYPHVGTARFVGAMLGDDGQLNAFGRAFATSFAPIEFGELVGVRR